jgi:hypothetical protein
VLLSKHGSFDGGVVDSLCCFGTVGYVRVFQRNADNNWLPLGQSLEGEQPSDQFGWGVRLSEDGRTMVVGVPFHASGAAGTVNVYYYDTSANTWNLLGSPILGNTLGAGLGDNVAIAADGLTVAAGAPALGTTGEPLSQVRVFVYDDMSNGWIHPGQSILEEEHQEAWGLAVSLPANERVVAGASGYVFDGSAPGQVRVYGYNEDSDLWEQIGLSIDLPQDFSGEGLPTRDSVKLSADGTTLVMGSSGQPPLWFAGETVFGVLRLFTLEKTDWIQVGSSVLAEVANDRWGFHVDLSADGRVFVAGAPDDTFLDRAPGPGTVRVFEAVCTSIHCIS